LKSLYVGKGGKTMKKLTSILLAVLMLTSVFVSCVGDDNTTTTDIPTTEAPTTEAPTTEAPTTETPTTEAPTTEAPTTEAPTTEAPTTEEPTVEPGIEYNIFYELNGGTNSRFNPDTYKTGEFVYLSSPEKENYVFAGWYTDPEFTNKVPVLMITSDTREATVLKAKELKIREYIIKPLSPAILKKRVFNILKIEETSSRD
jgi:uncharacterized repeat protein (TIGR02543 family)